MVFFIFLSIVFFAIDHLLEIPVLEIRCVHARVLKRVRACMFNVVLYVLPVVLKVIGPLP